MAAINGYTLIHFLIWMAAGRFLRLSWPVFLFLSLSWELLELYLPFQFAVESYPNKLIDILANVLGFAWGRKYRS